METNGGRKTDLWIALMKAGAATGCHQRYERSFHVMGYQFPLCARCTGLLTGQLAGLSAFLFASFRATETQPLAAYAAYAFVSILALGIDGTGQLKGFWVSNNSRRFLTGLFCGFFTAVVSVKLITSFLLRFLQRVR